MKLHDAGICKECGEVYDTSREVCCPVCGYDEYYKVEKSGSA